MSDASESADPDETEKTAAFQRLLTRSKQGDAAAVAELLQRWWPRILRSVRRHLSNQSAWRQLLDCDDCTQEVTVQLWQAFVRRQVRATTAAQLHDLIEKMVQIHIWRTWSRLTAKRRDSRRTVSLQAITEPFKSHVEDVWQIADHATRIGQLMRLMNAEEYELVWGHLMGFEWEELSRRYGITVPGVRSRYYRVIHRLRSEFPLSGGGGVRQDPSDLFEELIRRQTSLTRMGA